MRELTEYEIYSKKVEILKNIFNRNDMMKYQKLIIGHNQLEDFNSINSIINNVIKPNFKIETFKNYIFDSFLYNETINDFENFTNYLINNKFSIIDIEKIIL